MKLFRQFIAATTVAGVLFATFAKSSEDRIEPLVRVEIFENMALEKADADASKNSLPKSESQVFSGNDTTPYGGGFEGVRAIAPGQSPDRVYQANAFGFQRLPFKYDETGARLLPEGPIVLRASATLTYPKGLHRIVIRTRDDASLFLDGELIARIVVKQYPTDGHNPVQPLPHLVVPSIKEFAPGNTEKVVAIESDGKAHTYTLETVVGRGGRRPDLGVLAVAIAGPWESDFHLLGSTEKDVFSDQGWASFAVREESYYKTLDAEERSKRAADEKRYWRMRHDFAKAWIEENVEVQIPVVGEGIPLSNPIDAFVGRQIELAGLKKLALAKEEQAARAEGRILFHSDIKPILETHCFKCHGDQEKGGPATG